MKNLPEWLKNKWVLFALSAFGTLLLFFLIYLLFLRGPLSTVYTNQGLAYFDEQNYEKAIEKYERALDLSEENIDLYLYYADALAALEEYDRAIEILNQGIDHIRGEEELYLRKAKIFVEAGRIGAAVDFLDGIEDDLVNKYVQKKRPKDLGYLPAQGKYNSSQKITLDQREGETIYYTLSHDLTAEDPTPSSNRYTAPITISSNTALTAIAINEEGLVSPRLNLYYEIDNPNEPIDFEDPVIEKMVRQALDYPAGQIRAAQLAAVQSLSAESGDAIRSLNDLEYLPALNALYLYDQRLIVDYSVLGRLPSLTTLSIVDCGLTDATFSQLNSCTRLTELYVHDNNIRSLKPISDLRYLEYLDISSNDIQSLANLDFSALVYLNISDNGLSNLSGIETLATLQTLDISNNRISNLSVIGSLPELQELWMRGNTPTSLSPLGKLKKLVMLDVSDCGLITLSELNSFPALTSLIATNNNITSLASFTRKVEELQLNNNPISDLTPLNGQTNLYHLQIAQTQISDLAPLAALPALEYLDITDTAVTDSSPLKDCPALTNLYCSDTLNTADLPDRIHIVY